MKWILIVWFISTSHHSSSAISPIFESKDACMSAGFEVEKEFDSWSKEVHWTCVKDR